MASFPLANMNFPRAINFQWKFIFSGELNLIEEKLNAKLKKNFSNNRFWKFTIFLWFSNTQVNI